MIQHDSAYAAASFRAAIIVTALQNIGYGNDPAKPDEVQVITDPKHQAILVRLEAEGHVWMVKAAHVPDVDVFDHYWLQKREALASELVALSQSHPGDCILDFAVGALGVGLAALGFSCPRLKLSIPAGARPPGVVPGKDA